MDYVLMFIASLCVEVAAAFYTIALARGNAKLAVLATIIHSILSVLVVVNLVYGLHTLPAMIAGETLGTIAVMRMTTKKAAI